MIKNKNHYCVIMAGGAGVRFWPLSRDRHPKQFLDILGTGKTFIQQTFARFEKIIPKENILVVIGESHVNLVKKQLPDIADENILIEPVRRNTAPCIAYATYKLLAKNPDATVVVSPSDHLILDENTFIDTVQKCLHTAEQKKTMVTIGIQPTRPETGYGYIQINKKESDESGVFKVKTFTEKPNFEMAKIFVESGEFFWNSGIFIWSLDTIKKAFDTYLPDISELLSAGANIYCTDREKDFILNAYSECRAISIDFGIMEKAQNVDVVCADFGWSDLGTWGSLFLHKTKDESHNLIDAKNIFIENVKKSMIKANPNKLVVIKDIDNYLIVDTDDVLLVCPKTNDNDIKKLVDEALLKNRKYF
ncbi:MAG: mannose-1-phosphate guanylyltransferase [Prevotellaceae bacterium]|nr:mannose-1-phosphate guanylyltransferase [Prevotellaceae bacterium]